MGHDCCRGQAEDDSCRSHTSKPLCPVPEASWPAKKNRPHKAAGFSVADEGELIPRRRSLGLGGSGRSVLGSISRLAGCVGSAAGSTLHRVHGVGGSGSGGSRSSSGRSRSSSRRSRSSSRRSRSSSGRRCSSLLCRISSLLSGVSRLLGVLRGILRAVAASRQQRDERGGEKGTRKLHGGSPMPWNAIWPCINNAFVEIAPLLYSGAAVPVTSRFNRLS